MKFSPNVISIYSTFDTYDNAREMAKELLKYRLVACCNISKIDSLYNWKMGLCEEVEYALVLKSIKEKWIQIENYILKNHSYECPCIIKQDVETHAAYAKWVYEAVTKLE